MQLASLCLGQFFIISLWNILLIRVLQYPQPSLDTVVVPAAVIQRSDIHPSKSVMTLLTPILVFWASLSDLTPEKAFGLIYLSIILIYYPEIERLAERGGDIRCAFYLFCVYLCFSLRYCIPHVYMFFMNILQLGPANLDPADIEFLFAP
ncbi:hypothetical protein MKX08_001112 [Trichoderma sp. CBMAI-0020]|nr:hypothetical protein MKX08_001112 [Trichoderma sp. CBMAI-0020]